MSDTKTNADWKKREVGALWKKESSTQKYFSGHIKVDDGMGSEELVKVVIFKNNYKEKDNHPDFRIYTVDSAVDKKETNPSQENLEGSSSTSMDAVVEEVL